MILFSNKCGQLGNRLFAFSHLIGFAAANNVEIVNLSFDEYAQYFETTSKDVFCRYPATESVIKSNTIRTFLFLVNRLVLKLLRRLHFRRSALHQIVLADLPEYQFDQDRYYNLEKLISENSIHKDFTFLFGRFFRDYKNVQSYQDEIRRYFTPIPSIAANIQQFLTNVRCEKPDLVVGVHIRGGDYSTFVAGKYFYSQESYIEKMSELQGGMPNKNIKFIICSNERLDTTKFKLVNFVMAPNHLVEDMYILAGCDLIMGPPSTYSLWASFYGNKPLYQIRDIRKRPVMSDFVMLPSSVLYNFSFN